MMKMPPLPRGCRQLETAPHHPPPNLRVQVRHRLSKAVAFTASPWFLFIFIIVSTGSPLPPASPSPTPALSVSRGPCGQGEKAPPPQAVVKPQVLTHLIEGFVIQEGAEPFPVCTAAVQMFCVRFLMTFTEGSLLFG